MISYSMVPAALSSRPTVFPTAGRRCVHCSRWFSYQHNSFSSLPVSRSLETRRCRSGGGAACCSGERGRETSPTNPLPPMEDVASGMVEELLRRDENKVLMEGLEEASRRVEQAKAALADIERQEADLSRAKDYVLQLRGREAEIAESQKELRQARLKMEEAQISLTANMDEYSVSSLDEEDIDRDKERFESAKAAVIASLVGTAASIPIALYESTSFSQLFLHSAIISISCALFGVTFRYTVRRNLDNLQLKTGTCGAFGLVKGLAALESGKGLDSDTGSFVPYLIDGAIHISENIFIFLSAAIALDFCFKMGILSPFPMKR